VTAACSAAAPQRVPSQAQEPCSQCAPWWVNRNGSSGGTVSHTQLEHSSIVKFIEYNFLGATGQLQARDGVVHNLGSLLSPKLHVPS
jgi:hypothetical protein